MEDLNKILLESISKETTKKIVKQMEESIYNIYINNKNKGNGFFVKIQNKNKLKKVLITSNNVIGKREINNEESIEILLNNEKKINIKLDKIRKKYINEDTTTIEIDEEKDEIKGFINYMEIDDEIIKNKKEYNNKSIYIINKEKILYGMISEINEEIYYKSNIDESLIDSPILSLKNNKLIGINKGNKKGKLMINIIKEFNEMKNNIEEKLNEITIIYNINFLDYRIKLFDGRFVENNKEKCKIIIDNKEQEIDEYYDNNIIYF